MAMEPKYGPRGTIDAPRMVPSHFESRLVGICEPTLGPPRPRPCPRRSPHVLPRAQIARPTLCAQHHVQRCSPSVASLSLSLLWMLVHAGDEDSEQIHFFELKSGDVQCVNGEYFQLLKVHEDDISH